MNNIALTSWTFFKALATAKSGLVQYVEFSSYYEIFFFEAAFRYVITLFKDGGSDVTDFETNYKPTANATVSQLVDIGTTGGLALDSTVSGLSSKFNSLGQKTMAASAPVVIASDQSPIPVSISGDIITLPENIAEWGGVATSLGQKVMASSVPVTLASDQSALAVSQNGTWNITNISGTISLPTGAATELTLAAVKTDLDKFTFSSTRLLVDGSGVTQPVSGTVTANAGTGSFTVAQATAANLNAQIVGSSADGAAATPNPVVIGGNSVAGNVQTMNVDASGNVACTSVDGYKATYSAAASGVSFAAAATDIFTIYGSATKTIRVLRVSVTGYDTATSAYLFTLIKRSAVNTGGTSTILTGVPYDSNNPAVTASVRYYTANPTGLGAAVGTVVAVTHNFGATNNTPTDIPIYDHSSRPSQAIVLRGTAQGLCLNFGGQTAAGNVVSYGVEWTEE